MGYSHKAHAEAMIKKNNGKTTSEKKGPMKFSLFLSQNSIFHLNVLEFCFFSPFILLFSITQCVQHSVFFVCNTGFRPQVVAHT